MAIRNRSDLKSKLLERFPDNTVGLISPQKARDELGDMIDSFFLSEDIGVTYPYYENLPDSDTITLNFNSKIAGLVKLESTNTDVAISLSGLVKGGRYKLIVRKNIAEDVNITFDYNSLPVYSVGLPDALSEIVLSGASGKLFAIEFYSFESDSLLINNSGLVTNKGIVAKSSSIIYVYGEQIRKSINGGSSFSDNIPANGVGGSSEFVDVNFLNANVGIAVPYKSGSGASKISITLDGGTNWTDSSSSYTNLACCIAESTTVFYAFSVTSGQQFKKTSNAGTTWAQSSPVILNTIVSIKSAILTSAGKLYVCGSDRKIVKSVDSGVTWIDVSSTLVPSTIAWRSLTYESDSIVYVGGDSGYILKTINGGTSWFALALLTELGVINSIASAGTNKIMVVGSGGFAYSFDGGVTFQKNLSLTGLIKVSAVDENNIFMLDSSGGVYKYNSTSNEVLFAVELSGDIHNKGFYDASSGAYPSTTGLSKDDYYDLSVGGTFIGGSLDGTPYPAQTTIIWKGTYWKAY